MSLVLDTRNQAHFHNFPLLLRGAENNIPYSGIEATLSNGIVLPVVLTDPIYSDKPATDYSWRLELRVNGANAALSLMLPSEKNVRVLDVAPFVHKAAPQSLSFGGSSGITLTSSFVSMVPIAKYAFAANAELPFCEMTPVYLFLAARHCRTSAFRPTVLLILKL